MPVVCGAGECVRTDAACLAGRRTACSAGDGTGATVRAGVTALATRLAILGAGARVDPELFADVGVSLGIDGAAVLGEPA
jgi:hypothetical protein